MTSHLDLVTIICEKLDTTTHVYTELLGVGGLKEFSRSGDAFPEVR